MRKIVVTSGKGGVGKTTVTATLGRKLSAMGYKVVLVDGDVGLNNLDVVTGIEKRVVYDISDVLHNKCKPFQALIMDSESKMRVLPSSKESQIITAQAFRGVVDSFCEFDFVIIDCPAGIEHGFHRAVSSANEAIVVTTPSPSSIRDADKVLSILASYRLQDISLVVNRVRTDMVAKNKMLSASEIGSLLHLPPIGVIPDDDMITIYQQLGVMRLNNTTSRSYDVLAMNVANHTKVTCDIKAKRWFV